MTPKGFTNRVRKARISRKLMALIIELGEETKNLIEAEMIIKKALKAKGQIKLVRTEKRRR